MPEREVDKFADYDTFVKREFKYFYLCENCSRVVKGKQPLEECYFCGSNNIKALKVFKNKENKGLEWIEWIKKKLIKRLKMVG